MNNIKNSLGKLRASGERRLYMKEDGIFDRFMESLNSGLENKIALAILRSVNKYGYMSVTQTDLRLKYDVSERSIARVFKKALEHDILLKVGTRWYVNPYVVLPYNLQDEYCNKLQQMWTQLQRINSANRKVSLKEALLVYEGIFGPNYDNLTGEIITSH